MIGYSSVGIYKSVPNKELFEPKDNLNVVDELAQCESFAVTEGERLYIVGGWSQLERSAQEMQRRGRIILQ